MRIGIIGAMEEELCIIRKICSINIKNIKNTYKTYFGVLNNVKILLVESGIGKVLSAISAAYIIQNFHPHLIINVGVSGSLKKTAKIGSIVLSKKFCYYDVDVSAFGHNIGQIPGGPKYYFASQEFIKLIKKIFIFSNLKFKYGLFVSGDTFIYENNITLALKIKKFFPKAYAVDMETASIAQVCQKFLVPYVSIRSISDYVFNKPEKSFKKFCSMSVYRYSIVILKILKKLNFYYIKNKNLFK